MRSSRVCSRQNHQTGSCSSDRARGDARPDSDLDLLVIEESELPRYRRAPRYLRALVGVCPVKNVVVWTPNEIEAWRDVPNTFLTTVLREGRVLYER